jgi:hypothetical protein
MSDFKVGDRVEHVENAPGYAGTILDIDNGFAQIAWDRRPKDPDWTATKFLKATDEPAAVDPVNHPSHYTGHPSGIECIQITEHMGFNLGNALKYIWRCDLKHDAIEDLKKARWYIDRELAKRERQS